MNLNELTELVLDKAEGKDRFMVAIAGPPGSGKSTLAQKLFRTINDRCPAGTAVIVPMDGFHLDNATLDRLGLRERKGSAETFDAKGFLAMMQKIDANAGEVAVPEFDRDLDSTIDRGSKVLPSNKIILAEGNYLLLDTEPWNELSEIIDYSIFVNPGLGTLEERLIARWIDHGHDEVSARQRALSNDIPNAKTVINRSRSPDLTVDESL